MATAGSGTPAPLRSEARPWTPESAGTSTAPSPRAAPTYPPGSVEAQLFAQPYAFDFFQAVRILERREPNRAPVGRDGPARDEVVRFRAHLSLSFPPSTIYDLADATSTFPVPTMTVAFLGLTGPSGVLPRHYTELLLRLDKEAKGAEKYALRDWLDQFNHRFIALFYRAWEKYRFYIPYERGDHLRGEPDAFTRCLFSFIGLGVPELRKRLHVSVWRRDEEGQPRQQVLARIEDLALLHYSGFLSHRPRCAVALQALLQDYFQLPVAVQQFRGQWLWLDPENQSRLGGADTNCALGVNLVAGERVWDVQGKFRVRLGPLGYAQFSEFLPDRCDEPRRKTFFLLVHLVRVYVSAELECDVQLVLKAAEVPECRLADEGGVGPRLGWNTWIRSQPLAHDADEAVFEGDEVFWLNEAGAVY